MEQTTKRTRARKGDGTAYTTKDGRHRAAITVPDPVTGRPVRRWLSGRTPAEVRARLVAMRKHPAVPTPTVADYADHWLPLVRNRVRPATWRIYRNAMLHHIVPALGKVEVARLRPTDVEDMTARMLASGLAPSTVALTRRVLVAALTDAERDGIVTRNVARLSHPPRTPEAPPRSRKPVRRPLGDPRAAPRRPKTAAFPPRRTALFQIAESPRYTAPNRHSPKRPLLLLREADSRSETSPSRQPPRPSSSQRPPRGPVRIPFRCQRTPP